MLFFFQKKPIYNPNEVFFSGYFCFMGGFFLVLFWDKFFFS